MEVTINEASLLLREAFEYKVGNDTKQCVFLNLLWDFCKKKEKKYGKESKKS